MWLIKLACELNQALLIYLFNKFYSRQRIEFQYFTINRFYEAETDALFRENKMGCLIGYNEVDRANRLC
jgi:hypothetical protein